MVVITLNKSTTFRFNRRTVGNIFFQTVSFVNSFVKSVFFHLPTTNKTISKPDIIIPGGSEKRTKKSPTIIFKRFSRPAHPLNRLWLICIPVPLYIPHQCWERKCFMGHLGCAFPSLVPLFLKKGKGKGIPSLLVPQEFLRNHYSHSPVWVRREFP